MRIVTIIALILLSAAVQAQKPDAADSIYFYEQSSKEIRFLTSNGTQFINTPLRKAGYASIQLTLDKGHFRRAQEAEQSTIARMHTEGFSTTGRFKTAGYFLYSRTWEDSLAWTQKADNNVEQPYYLASAKAGPGQRQLYNMGGLVSYNLLKNKIYLNSGLDYKYGLSSRSIDPRLNLYNFALTLRPEVSYQWKSQVLGAGFNWGYGNENISLSYQNDNYKNGSETYPDRVNYIIQGFGNIRNAGLTLRKKHKTTGFAVNYTANIASWTLRAEAAYNISTEDNTLPLSGSVRDSLIATYQLESTQMHLQLRRHTLNTSQQLIVTAGNQNGRDFNVRAAASTYTYRHNYVSLQYLALFRQQQQWQPELGFTFLYDDTYRKDGISSHMQQYQWLQPGIKGSLYLVQKNQDRLAFCNRASKGLPVTSNLQVPATQVTYFTKGVVYPDYQYQVTKTLETLFSFQYITRRIFKTLPAGISGKCIYTSALHTPAPVYITPLSPGNSRLFSTLSFNLYF